MASGQTSANKGRTYDRTVPHGSDLEKHLASRVVPHMSQSTYSTPIHKWQAGLERPSGNRPFSLSP